MSLGSRLRKLISDRNLGHKDVAQAMGVTPQAISKWISSDKIKRDRLVQLAEYFDVSVVWLLTGEGTSKGAASFVLIPIYKTFASQTIVDYEAVSSQWLSKNGYHEPDLFGIYATDNFAYNIKQGSLVMINRGATDIVDGKYHATKVGKELRVRLLNWTLDGELRVTIDIEKYDVIKHPEAVKVLGQVVKVSYDL